MWRRFTPRAVAAISVAFFLLVFGPLQGTPSDAPTGHAATSVGEAATNVGELSIQPLAVSALSEPYSIFNFKNVGSSVVDPGTGYLYVSNNEGSSLGSRRTTIFDPVRSSVVGFIEGVAGPMVFDSAHGELVVLQDDGAVFVNTSTGQVVASVFGLAPEGWRHPVIALDPVEGLVYAANNFQSNGPIWLGSTIHVLGVRLHAAVAQINGLWWTSGIAFDAQDGNLYVTSNIRGMTVIDPRMNAVIGALSGFDGPNEVAFNPDDGNLYVPSSNGRYVNEGGTVREVCTAGVAIVDPRTRQIVGTIAGFHAGCNGPNHVVYDPDDRNLYVANETSIVAVDPSTRLFRWEISDLEYPGPLTYDPVNHHVYAASGDGFLDLDPVARQVASIGQDYASPFAVAYDSSRNRVYATNRVSTSVVVIDGATNRIVGHLQGFSSPDSVTYDPLADELFVGNERNYTLSIVDLGTNRTVGTIPSVLPWGVLYDSRSGHVFVSTDTGMDVVSGQTNTIIANVTAYGSLSPIAVDSVHGRIFALTEPNVTYPAPVHLIAFDSANLTVLWEVNETDLGITCAAFDPLNENLYAGLWGGGGIAVIESTTGRVLTRIPGSFLPTAVLFNPSNGYVYVADQPGYGVLWVIDGSSNRVIHQIALPDEPNRMAYDDANQAIYVALGHPLESAGLVAAVPSLVYPTESSSIALWIVAIGGGVSALVLAVVLIRRRRARLGSEGGRNDGHF